MWVVLIVLKLKHVISFILYIDLIIFHSYFLSAGILKEINQTP